MNDIAFWKLEALSDRQLLDGLGAVLGSGRRLVAELVAHLGEVEERRLHLEAACSSMFSYCVNRLGLSEDEACRRIEVARLARRYPAIFPLLAAGKLSLSVAALLKPHLSVDNQLDLLATVSGKSVQQAREVLAARFPRPDVPSSLRKLPEPRAAQPPSTKTPAPAVSQGGAVCTASPPSGTFTWSSLQSLDCPLVTLVPEACTDGNDDTTSTSQPSVGSRSPAQKPRVSRIEPLAAQRYKVQFTADAELKSKLELAQDLLRHAHPSGDFGLIIGRALDLLIETLMKRRFGVRARRKAHSTAKPSNAAKRFNTASPSDSAKPSYMAMRSDAVTPSDTAQATVTTGDGAVATPSSEFHPSRAATSRYVSRAARRSVLERDGLRCSWVDARGSRCDARAWLEHDHCQPRGQGGGAEPDNLRLLCRAHNHFAAEREYGRAHIERAVAERRGRRAQASQ